MLEGVSNVETYYSCNQHTLTIDMCGCGSFKCCENTSHSTQVWVLFLSWGVFQMLWANTLITTMSALSKVRMLVMVVKVVVMVVKVVRMVVMTNTCEATLIF